MENKVEMKIVFLLFLNNLRWWWAERANEEISTDFSILYVNECWKSRVMESIYIVRCEFWIKNIEIEEYESHGH